MNHCIKLYYDVWDRLCFLKGKIVRKRMTLKEIINKIKKLKQKYKSEKNKKSGNGRKSHGNISNSWTDFYPKDTMMFQCLHLTLWLRTTMKKIMSLTCRKTMLMMKIMTLLKVLLKHVIIFSYYDYIFTRTLQLHILNSVM